MPKERWSGGRGAKARNGTALAALMTKKCREIRRFVASTLNEKRGGWILLEKPVQPVRNEVGAAAKLFKE